MYFPGLDIILSILYLILLIEEGKHTARRLDNPGKQGLIAIIWQMPGLLFVVSIITELDHLTELAYYFIFMLELWHTPIIPLVSLLPAGTFLDKPLYYYALFLMVPLLAILFYLPALKLKQNN